MSTSTDGPSSQAQAQAAATRLRELTTAADHDIALVMGSGWMPAADALGPADHEIVNTDLPGFAPPAVEGTSARSAR